MQVKFVNAKYEKENTLILNLERSDVDRYVKKGYKVISFDNGTWKLFKPAEVVVKVLTEKPQQLSFRVGSKILDLYHEDKMSEEAFNVFVDEARSGKLKFYLGENGLLNILAE